MSDKSRDLVESHPSFREKKCFGACYDIGKEYSQCITCGLFDRCTSYTLNSLLRSLRTVLLEWASGGHG